MDIQMPVMDGYKATKAIWNAECGIEKILQSLPATCQPLLSRRRGGRVGFALGEFPNSPEIPGRGGTRKRAGEIRNPRGPDEFRKGHRGI